MWLIFGTWINHKLPAVSSATLNQAAKRPPKTGFVLDKARKELGYEPHSFVEGLAVSKLGKLPAEA
ncbi:MAG: hypothetical protein U5L96_02315 [Owenweeksia sp.]|nr:hypothetical protein [Owenweeksia sp.]